LQSILRRSIEKLTFNGQDDIVHMSEKHKALVLIHTSQLVPWRHNNLKYDFCARNRTSSNQNTVV